MIADLNRFAIGWYALDSEVILGSKDVFCALRLEVDRALRHTKALE